LQKLTTTDLKTIALLKYIKLTFTGSKKDKGLKRLKITTKNLVDRAPATLFLNIPPFFQTLYFFFFLCEKSSP